MITMVVRHELRIDVRQLGDVERGRDVAADAGANALRKDGIDEQRYSVELHEPAGVAEPGQARRLTDSGWLRQQGDIRVDAWRGRRDVIATTAAKHLVDDRPLQNGRERLWLRAVQIDEAKPTRCRLFHDTQARSWKMSGRRTTSGDPIAAPACP